MAMPIVDRELGTYEQKRNLLDKEYVQCMMQIQEQYRCHCEAVHRAFNVNESVYKWLAMLEDYVTNVLAGLRVDWNADVTQHAKVAFSCVQTKRFPEAYDAVRKCQDMLGPCSQRHGTKHSMWTNTLRCAQRWLSEWIVIRTCHNVGQQIDKCTLCGLMERVFGRSLDDSFISVFALSYKTVCHWASYHQDSNEFEEKARKVFFGPLSKDVLHMMHEAYKACRDHSPYASKQDLTGIAKPGQKKKRLAQGDMPEPTSATSSGSTTTTKQQCPVRIDVILSTFSVHTECTWRGQYVAIDPAEPVQLQECDRCGRMECIVQTYKKTDSDSLCSKCLDNLMESALASDC